MSIARSGTSKATEPSSLLADLRASGVVLIVRLPSADGLDDVTKAAIRGGVGALEVTTNTPGALEWLSSATARFEGRILLGMGTVLDMEQAEAAIEAGARFCVSPVLDLDILQVVKKAGLLMIPGGLTPPEILNAWRAGADMVKLFPANIGGPRYVSDVLAPLDDVLLFPTGGIDERNAADFIRAGAAAVAIGASVVNRESVAQGRFDDIAERCGLVVRSIAAARSAARTPAGY